MAHAVNKSRCAELFIELLYKARSCLITLAASRISSTIQLAVTTSKVLTTQEPSYLSEALN